jgi:hypothetical protein
MTDSANNTNPTYANTLLSKHLPTLGNSRHSFFQKLVVPAGYPFFEWGDRIYQVQDDIYADTGRMLSDLAQPLSETTATHVGTLKDWEAAKNLISDIREQAQAQFGEDFSDRDD